ncbi:MAG TPA: flagellar basal body rod protein FlgB [Chromatiales bacterium]|nr:flagellar basal body rod protein FlgB [Chromatiales bacterium]
MPINLDTALGVHPLMLRLRTRRAEVLAANIANADTPHYKARDVDFRQVLSQVNPGVPLERTNPAHMTGSPGPDAVPLAYRIPLQPALDGNTVEPQVEKAAFMDNALRYQASLRFLDGKVKSILSALRGE